MNHTGMHTTHLKRTIAARHPAIIVASLVVAFYGLTPPCHAQTLTPASGPHASPSPTTGAPSSSSAAPPPTPLQSGVSATPLTTLAPTPTQPSAPAHMQRPVPARAPAPSSAERPVTARAPSAPFTPNDAGVIISAERMFGLHLWTIESGGEERTGTNMSVIWGHSETSTGEVLPSALPRCGIDFVVGPGFTLGGSLGVSISSSRNAEGEDQGSVSTTSVAPRIGFLGTPYQSFSIWLRGGIAYIKKPDTPIGNIERTLTATTLNFEPAMVLSPAPHVAITLGPVIDIGLGGKTDCTRLSNTVMSDGSNPAEEATCSTEERDVDFKVSSFGVTAGIALFF